MVVGGRDRDIRIWKYMKRRGGGWMVNGLDDLGQAGKVALAVVCLAVTASPVGKLEGGVVGGKRNFQPPVGVGVGWRRGVEKWPRT